jgi:hypothetical protein
MSKYEDVLKSIVKDAIESEDDKDHRVNRKDRFIYKRMDRHQQEAVLDKTVSKITSFSYSVGCAIDEVLVEDNPELAELADVDA